jgi:para-nitrobenzyl esterase
VRDGQPVWLYRFTYVSESQRGKLMGTLHGFEIPFALDLPAALVGDKVRPTDDMMADLTSVYWVQSGKSGDPHGGGRPDWLRSDSSIDRLLHFTNSGIIIGTDSLKLRLDIWERAWSQTK